MHFQNIRSLTGNSRNQTVFVCFTTLVVHQSHFHSQDRSNVGRASDTFLHSELPSSVGPIKTKRVYQTSLVDKKRSKNCSDEKTHKLTNPHVSALL